MLRCYYYHLFYIYTIYKSDSGTLFFIELYVVREFFEIFVIFHTEYVFSHWPAVCPYRRCL